MPTPTIPDGRLYMTPVLWTSAASVQTVTGSQFQPDLVWVKSRTSSSANEGFHHLVDSVRGVGKVLSSNATDAEYWSGTNYSVQSFNSNGFNSGIYDGLSGNTMVSWLWKAGGAAVSNTDGSITSQVSANTTSGFSVVTWTGTSAVGTVGHGLGVAPKMIIAKSRSTANAWGVYTASTGNTGFLLLNSTAAFASDINAWNNTTPTSSVFSLGNGGFNSGTMVAYCWSEVAGYSKFGSYTGNGSADGPFCYTGFQPKFVMWKRSDSTGDWIIFDSSRNTYNYEDAQLVPNSAAAEQVTGGGFVRMDFLSNGFKIRSTDSYINANGGTYIFACFASNPFKYSNAR